MRRPVVQFILLGLWVPFILGAGPAPPAKTTGLSTSVAPGARDADRERLEYSFLTTADWLGKTQQDRTNLQGSIEALQEKIAKLRRQTGPNPNVIDQMRIKSNLNELQDQLQTDASLQRHQEEKQKTLEQQGSALIILYNDRIEEILGTSETLPPGPSSLDAKLELLTLYVRKRDHAQNLLARFKSKTPNEDLRALLSSAPPKGNDIESLQLTLDLFHDRKVTIEDQLRKWSAEQDEIKSELKLQGKMREFVDDFQGMNDLPQNRVKDGELQGLVGKKQKSNLESRLFDVQTRIAQGQKTLLQLTEMTGRIQYQLDKFKGVMKK